ncbi:MAG: NUDIX hydrolase [Candidatus Pacebacteria bacterium]|nr:NUDIX hydrolase [Candidatus Paceibacterota bacterium]
MRDTDVFENLEFEEPSKYQYRVTVKAIVKNDEEKIAFVTNPVHGFYLLPGGGAESDDLGLEIYRECVEEINFKIKNIKEIFRIKEFRNRDAKEYETICFFAKSFEKIKEDLRTEDEKNNGLRVVWFTEEEALRILENQLNKLKNGEVKFYNTAFNILRDYNFFVEYLK